MNKFKVGDHAIAKVGHNEINVEILAMEEKSYLVQNNVGKRVSHSTVDRVAGCKRCRQYRHPCHRAAEKNAHCWKPPWKSSALQNNRWTQGKSSSGQWSWHSGSPLETKRPSKRSTGQSSARTRPKNIHASSKKTSWASLDTPKPNHYNANIMLLSIKQSTWKKLL